MKKFVLAVAALSIVTAADAQKKNIQSASNSLKYKEYKEAIEYIDQAIKDPSTQDDPKAWMVRGDIYLTMDQDPEHAEKGHYKEAVSSYIKVAELKPTYETDRVNSGLVYGAYKAYNASILASNAQKYDEAYDNAVLTIQIQGLDGGKRFADNKKLDTLASDALMIQAYSAYNAGQYDKALPVLEQLKNDPIGGNANVYLLIASLHEKKGDNPKLLAIIEEGKKRFPNNKDIRNKELNYYISTNQQDVLLKKLEEAVKNEPDNAVYQNNLANAYTKKAFPDTEGDKKAARVENFEELIKMAEKAFNAAIAKDPENLGYHFDIAVLYYNHATEIVNDMNNITGTSPEDDKKYNALKAESNAIYAKALPHFEKVFVALEAKAKSLNEDEKTLFNSSAKAMREIYVRKDDLNAGKEIKARYENSLK